MTGSGGRIGYYVHHVGSGHRQRATALAVRLADRGVAVTGLSSLARPATWPGAWVQLEPDDVPRPGPDDDATAGGRLHWAPLHHAGLARRTAAVSSWLAQDAPDLLVSDVSQEVTVLARLHGVPVVSVLLPGRRDDPTHVLGLEVSSDVVGFWPDTARDVAPGLPGSVAARLHQLGGMARFIPEPDDGPRPGAGSRRGVVLAGTGGGAECLVAAARELAGVRPDWSWRVLGQGVEGRGPWAGGWVDDPWSVLREADVILTHAGQNAVAEVAAARVPAIVIAQPRPYDEQGATARALSDPVWPALVVDAGTTAWSGVLERAAALDGRAWSGWVDGRAADRFVDLVLARCQARCQARRQARPDRLRSDATPERVG